MNGVPSRESRFHKPVVTPCLSCTSEWTEPGSNRRPKEFQVLDPPNQKVYTVSAGELLALSDGLGIVVEVRPGTAVAALAFSVVASGAWLFCALLVALGLERAALRWRWSVPVRVLAALVVVSGVAVGWHLTWPAGLLYNPAATAQVRDLHHFIEVPNVSWADLRGEETIWIDARLPRTFVLGTIPGAINLPITANAFERRDIVAGLPRSGHLVLFCQSDRCDWAHQMASYLMWQGFSRVSIYEAGYAGWQREQTAATTSGN